MKVTFKKPKKFVNPNSEDNNNGLYGRLITAAAPRLIRAEWTPELAQDLQAYHNIDAEAELAVLLGVELARVIDVQILNDLYDYVDNNLIWDDKNGGPKLRRPKKFNVND